MQISGLKKIQAFVQNTQVLFPLYAPHANSDKILLSELRLNILYLILIFSQLYVIYVILIFSKLFVPNLDLQQALYNT